MKYVSQIEINQPLEKVMGIFQDPESLKHWQPGFISITPVSGEPGKDGSVSELKYRTGRGEMVMKETIMKNALPDSFNSLYEAGKVKNWNNNRFETTKNGTLWIQENEFKARGGMRLMMALFPGMFKKQTYVYLKSFKAYAENGTSVAGK